LLLLEALMSDLYEADILAWSERQAELLRRVAAGERLNEQPDWENVVEEIESVGREQLHAVESLLVQAMLHMAKAAAWPDSSAVPGWLAEARRFRGDAARRFAPSMRRRIDVAGLYRAALRAMPDVIDGQGPLDVMPVACPFTLEGLLGDDEHP